MTYICGGCHLVCAYVIANFESFGEVHSEVVSGCCEDSVHIDDGHGTLVTPDTLPQSQYEESFI